MKDEPTVNAVACPVEGGVGRPAPQRCDGCALPNGCPEYCRCIDTADHVRHAPSGEDWVVAYVRGDRLAWCGWPHGEAAVADCELVKKATPAERDELLAYMAAIAVGDMRATYARRRIAEQAEQEAARA